MANNAEPAEKDIPCGPHCGPDFEGLTYHCPSACCHQRSAEKDAVDVLGRTPLRATDRGVWACYEGSCAMLLIGFVSKQALIEHLRDEHGLALPLPPADSGTSLTSLHDEQRTTGDARHGDQPPGGGAA